mgnify:CR=1 FL=1
MRPDFLRVTSAIEEDWGITIGGGSSNSDFTGA